MKDILVLGAGTAGTMMANKLHRALSEASWRITVLDRDDVHVYQPGLLFVPFGSYRPEEVVRPRRSFLRPGVRTLLTGIDSVDTDHRRVTTGDGEVLTYDILVVATGCRIAPELVNGLTGEGWQSSAFDFYTLPGATALCEALRNFEGGKLLVNVAEMPIKCPVAPLEFLFLADAYFTARGNRHEVDLRYATPLDGAFTKPKASQMLGDLLEQKGIAVEAEVGVESVDGGHRILNSYDGRSFDYDLLVSVPTHTGSEAIMASGLGDDMGFVPTDKHTLQCTRHPEVFAIGDATDVPASKAGAVAHFQADVLLQNIRRFIDDLPLAPDFDGHANCFIETGHGKAMLIDFNYETEPLPGRFPLPGIGPFTLLEESHVNHWGKLGFRWVYWNKLLPGDELPLDHRMLMAGKWS